MTQQPPRPAAARRLATAASLAAALVGTASSFYSAPAHAFASPGILPGIVCAVPIDVCLRVVTHATVGGVDVVKDKPLIPALGPLSLLPGQAIDVDGDGRDDLRVKLAVPVTLLPPGYEANRPTLSVTKLSGAKPNLPVKVEIVTSASGGGRMSFGYDARVGGAPNAFTAAIDLTDRDHQADTSQALVQLSITAGNSTGVSLVTETFDDGTGLAESERTHRNVTQIGYRAVAALGTRVPASATIDYTSSPGMQHVELTRSQPTTGEILLDAPGHDPRIAARLDKLPASVDLTLVSEDADHDGAADLLSVDYSGSDVTPEATLSYESVSHDAVLGDHRPKFDFAAHTLPKVVHLDYDIAHESLALGASARVAGVDVTGTDTVPFFERADTFTLNLEDLPLALDAGFGGGHVTFDAWTDAHRQAHDQLAALGFRGQDVAAFPIPVPDCGSATCDDGYDALRDPTRNGAVREDVPERYLLAARLHKLRRADIVTTPNTDILIDTAPDLGPPGSACGEFPPPDCTAQSEGYRPFEALLKSPRVDDDPVTPPTTTIHAKLGTLWPQTRFTQGHAHVGPVPWFTVFDYDYITYANGSGLNTSTNLTVDADNIAGPTGTQGQHADTLHVRLDAVPPDLSFTYGAGGFPMKLRSNALGVGIGLIDVRFASAGATDADLLPKEETVDYNFTPANTADDVTRNLDGVRIRDFADRYSIHARIQALQAMTVDQDSHGGTDTPCQEFDKLCVQLKSSLAGNHPRLRFDSETYARYNFDGGTFLPGVARVFATLDQIPASLTLRQFEGANHETRLLYNGATAIGVLGDSERKGFELAQTTTYDNPAPDGIRPDGVTDLSIAPMPTVFDLCSSGDNAVCSDGIFERTDADGGSLHMIAQPRARFRYTDQPNAQAQVYTIADITADRFRFQADATDAGYLAFDTGALQIGHSVIKQVKGTRDITTFDLPDLFAASGRVIAWDSSLTLFAADHTDITSLLDRSGVVTCPSGTSLVLNRVEPHTSLDLVLDLSNELCE